MPSGRAKRLPSLEPVVFFLDRGLGRHVLANALRDEDQAVLTMAEIYPDGANMVVSDPDWIRRSNDEGWIALTKDPAIIFAHATCSRKRPCACLRSTTQTSRAPVMAARPTAHLNRILQRARKSGPCVYVITADGLEFRWPRPLPN